MKALSEDLRVRVVEAREAGESIAEVAERFAVSVSSVKRMRRQVREQGRLDFRSPPGRPARFERDTLESFAAQLREHAGRPHGAGWPGRCRLSQDSAVLPKTAQRNRPLAILSPDATTSWTKRHLPGLSARPVQSGAVR